MTQFRGDCHALHVATYSGWYRFEQRDEAMDSGRKALTFLETDWAASRSSRPAPRLCGDGTFRTLRQRQRRRRMEAGKAQCAALDDRFFAGTSRSDTCGQPCRPRFTARLTAANGGNSKACASARLAAASRKSRAGRAHAFSRRRQSNAAPSLRCHRVAVCS